MTYNTPRPWMLNQVLTGTTVVMLLGYVIMKLPFTLRMTKAAFYSLDDSLEDAAKNLGARSSYTFFRVLLPIILPTVLAILALNFNALLTDYDMSVFLYHPLNQPVGVYIRTMTNSHTIVLYFVYGRGSKVDESSH